MRLVAEGTKNKDVFVKETLQEMEGVFDQVYDKIENIKEHLKGNVISKFEDQYGIDSKTGDLIKLDYLTSEIKDKTESNNTTT